MRERQRPTEVGLRLYRPLKSAVRTDIIEQGGREAPLRDGRAVFPIAPAGIETIRVSF